MTLLHITNDFSGSTVYKNLISHLDSLGVRQIVYTPVKHQGLVGKNHVQLKVPGSEIIYDKILNKHLDRLFYRRKIKKIITHIENRIDITEVDQIHAHTWYSDGGVAYLLSKKHRIPYVVTVRNSDLNVFYRYLIHERTIGRKILENAKKITLISAVYKIRLAELLTNNTSSQKLNDKMTVIPNGVDPYWINNKVTERSLVLTSEKPVEILYVGKFDKGKNVFNLIRAIRHLNDEKMNCQLVLVGGGGDDQNRVMRCVENYTFVRYLGVQYDRDKLREIFRNADIFAMPSKAETFGLVYIEALLQGIPVIYTKGEGIDGFYDNSIGEKVVSTSPKEIANCIRKIISKYGEYDFNPAEIAQAHDWTAIGKRYLQLYCV